MAESSANTLDVDVAVVGGGVMGSAAAYHCAARGLRCALLERFALGGHSRGSSHGASRIVRRSYPSRLYTALMRRAYELWAEADAERASLSSAAAAAPDAPAGDGPLLDRVGGGLDLVGRGSRVHGELLAACAAAGAPLLELAPAEALARFGLRLRADEVALLQADTCTANASRGVAAFQRLATARGAALLGEADVVAIAAEGGGDEASRRFLVSAADGRRVRARRVVVCPGPWAAPLLSRLLGLELAGALRVWQCTTMLFRRRVSAAPAEPLPVLIDYGDRPMWSRRQGGAGVEENAAAAAGEKGEGEGAADGGEWDDAAAEQPVYSCPSVGEPTRAKFAVHRGAETTADGRDFVPDVALTVAPVQAWLRQRLPAFDADAPEEQLTCLYTMSMYSRQDPARRPEPPASSP